MLDAPGAGLAAPQIGVGLRVFTWYVDGEVGHLVNPDLTLSEETQDGEEGCLSIPDLVFDCTARDERRRPRLRHVRRAGDDRGLASCWPARSSTRPTTSTASSSSSGSTPRPARPRCGRSGSRSGSAPRPRSRSARTPPRLVCDGWASDAGRLRRHPRGRPAVPPGARRRAATSSSAWSPGPTPRTGAAASSSPRRSRSSPRSSASRCSSPSHPRDPEFQEQLRELRARLLPGGRLRRAAAAVRARHPRARLGEPALLDPAGLARSRAGPAGAVGRRRVHRRHHLPHRAGPRRRADVRRGHRAGPDHRHRRRPAGPARRGRGAAAGGHARRHRGRQPGGAAPARGRGLAGAEDPGRGRRGALDRAGARRRPPDPRLHPGTRRLDDVRRGAAQARPGPPRRGRARPARRACSRSTRTPCTSAPAPCRCGSARSRRSARSRWPPPTGRAACGPARRPARRGWKDDRPPVPGRAPRPGGRRPPPARPGPTRPASRPTRCCARSAGRTPTPTSCSRRGSVAPARRPRRRVRHRAGGRDAAPPGHLRRGRRRLREPSARAHRRRGARRAAAGRPPAARPRGWPPTPRSPPRSTWCGPRSGTSATGFVNAVLRRVADRTLDAWVRAVAPDPATDPIGFASVAQSHPRWVVEALQQALRPGRPCRRARRPARGRQRCRRGSPSSPGQGWSSRDELVAAGGDGDAATRRSAWCSTPATRLRCRRSPRGGPGCRTRARSWSPSRSPRRRVEGRDAALAGPLRRARGQGRAARCGRRRPRGARCSPWSASPTGPTSSYARPRPCRPARSTVLAGDGTAPAWEPGTLRPGARRRPVHRAGRAAAPARVPLAADARPTSTALVPLQVALLGPRPGLGAARRGGRLRDLLTGARRDRRRGQHGARSAGTTSRWTTPARRSAGAGRGGAAARHGAAVAAPARDRRDVPGPAAPALRRAPADAAWRQWARLLVVPWLASGSSRSASRMRSSYVACSMSTARCASAACASARSASSRPARRAPRPPWPRRCSASMLSTLAMASWRSGLGAAPAAARPAACASRRR